MTAYLNRCPSDQVACTNLSSADARARLAVALGDSGVVPKAAVTSNPTQATTALDGGESTGAQVVINSTGPAEKGRESALVALASQVLAELKVLIPEVSRLATLQGLNFDAIRLASDLGAVAGALENDAIPRIARGDLAGALRQVEGGRNVVIATRDLLRTLGPRDRARVAADDVRRSYARLIARLKAGVKAAGGVVETGVKFQLGFGTIALIVAGIYVLRR